LLERRSVNAGIAGWMIMPAAAVRAQAWPSQPVKLVLHWYAVELDRDPQRSSNGALPSSRPEREARSGETLSPQSMAYR